MNVSVSIHFFINQLWKSIKFHVEIESLTIDVGISNFLIIHNSSSTQTCMYQRRISFRISAIFSSISYANLPILYGDIDAPHLVNSLVQIMSIQWLPKRCLQTIHSGAVRHLNRCNFSQGCIMCTTIFVLHLNDLLVSTSNHILCFYNDKTLW